MHVDRLSLQTRCAFFGGDAVNAQAVRGRFAPSPTGALHLGNLRTALLAWLFARKAGGSFVLRVEDLDMPRVRPRATSQMLDDLVWLGLDWDEGPSIGGPFGPYFQSARQALYEAVLAYLREQDLIYPCYCTRAKLNRLASAPQQGEDMPYYPGTCRNLTPGERRKRERNGERASLRFRAPETPIRFRDTIAGEQVESVADVVGDILVRRSDGIIAYQLSVVVDDALMGITQVVRGADLLGSTARQLALYDAIGYPRPREYAHVPLVVGMSGERLAKRDGSVGLEQVRNSGISPEHVLGALAASAGFWPAGTPATPYELLTSFDVARLRNTTYPLVV